MSEDTRLAILGAFYLMGWFVFILAAFLAVLTSTHSAAARFRIPAIVFFVSLLVAYGVYFVAVSRMD
jgi:hypothetical protein